LFIRMPGDGCVMKDSEEREKTGGIQKRWGSLTCNSLIQNRLRILGTHDG